jgi:WD40 repeat protein
MLSLLILLLPLTLLILLLPLTLLILLLPLTLRFCLPPIQVDCCAWSPDGLWLASASQDRTLRVWGVSLAGVFNRDATWHEMAKLEGHGHSVSSCAWSPDGMRLASASMDMTVRVWDVGARREAGAYTRPPFSST